LTIRDDGMGGCTWARSAGFSGFPLGPFQPCRDLFPGTACASYQGALSLATRYNGSSSFVDPDFQKHLNTVGLGNVKALAWMHVYLVHLAPIPRDVRLAFLPGLTLIQDQLAAIECTSEENRDYICGGTPPSQSRLVALSATSTVYRMRDIYVRYTGLKDTMFIRGLKCPPQYVTLDGNRALVPARNLDGGLTSQSPPPANSPPPPTSPSCGADVNLPQPGDHMSCQAQKCLCWARGVVHLSGSHSQPKYMFDIVKHSNARRLTIGCEMTGVTFLTAVVCDEVHRSLNGVECHDVC
jgi:hypothetical protein